MRLFSLRKVGLAFALMGMLFLSCSDGDDNGEASGGNGNNDDGYNTPQQPEYSDEARMELPKDTVVFAEKMDLSPEALKGQKKISIFFKTDYEYELEIKFKRDITYRQICEAYSKGGNMLERIPDGNDVNSIEQISLTYSDLSNHLQTIHLDTNYYMTSNYIYISGVDIISKKSGVCNAYMSLNLSTLSKDASLVGGCKVHIQ